MKIKNSFIRFAAPVIISAITLLASCSAPKDIQRNLNAGRYSLSYIMDSKISTSKSGTAVRVEPVQFDRTMMIDSCQVKRKGAWVVPLVLLNVWGSKSQCIQGMSMFEEDIPTFFRESLIKEINRSGSISSDSLNTSQYTVELSIDKIKTEGPYVSSGLFYFALYFYGFFQTETAGPAISEFKASYKLKKGGEIIHTNSLMCAKKTELITKQYNNAKVLQHDYAVSMVEAVSMNLKATAEWLVADLDSFFARELGQPLR